MDVSTYRVSERGQMALPADARRRWNLTNGGAVELVDLGDAIVIVPAGRGGLRAMLSDAVAAEGGYPSLVAAATADEPELT